MARVCQKTMGKISSFVDIRLNVRGEKSHLRWCFHCHNRPPHDGIQIDPSARDPPRSALNALSRATNELKTNGGFADWSNIQAPDRFCGRVVNVAIWEREIWDYIESNIEVGSFIRLRNVSYELLSGFKCWCKFRATLFRYFVCSALLNLVLIPFIRVQVSMLKINHGYR